MVLANRKGCLPVEHYTALVVSWLPPHQDCPTAIFSD